jgi:hypothetical protein
VPRHLWKELKKERSVMEDILEVSVKILWSFHACFDWGASCKRSENYFWVPYSDPRSSCTRVARTRKYPRCGSGAQILIFVLELFCKNNDILQCLLNCMILEIFSELGRVIARNGARILDYVLRSPIITMLLPNEETASCICE